MDLQWAILTIAMWAGQALHDLGRQGGKDTEEVACLISMLDKWQPVLGWAGLGLLG